MDGSIPITVVIPIREGGNADITLATLQKQTIAGSFDIITVNDQGKGACWARNEGFKQVKTEFTLFSDDDIEWETRALETMLKTLKMSKASYCYGRYYLNDDLWCHQDWNANMLKQKNYISTMSLFRTRDLPENPFDESIKRLQDWDLYLNLLINYGRRGVYCEDLIFRTKVKPGISHGNPVTYIDAILTVKKKYNL